MSHLETKRITPENLSQEGVLFDVPMTMLPGRVALCMYPPRTQSDGGILLGGQEGAVGSKYQPDFGIVACSGVDEVHVGQTVTVKPYDGVWLTHREFSWIPEGRQVRIYPTQGESWSDSIEAVYEL
jgi:hypothetical protein